MPPAAVVRALPPRTASLPKPLPTPLAFRVPRPPAVFVGREVELARVLDRLQRGGLAVVTGVGGLGKTALASRAVEALGASGDAIFVGLRAGADLALELGRALAATEGFDAADWSVSRSDPEAMIDGVVELVEAGGRLVVVDDLHEAGERAEDCLRRVASHCRDSRWIVTSRREPRWPGSEELIVPLAALERHEIEDLLASCAPHVDGSAREAIAAVAAGSPWRARSHLRGSPGDERVTAGLTERELAILALLNEVSVPIPIAILDEGRKPDPSTVERLEREGLVQAGQASVRLHDVARAQLMGAGLPAPDPVELRQLTNELLSSRSPDLEIEGARLWSVHGGDPEDLAPIRGCASGWIEGGLAERAFSALEGATEPRLLRERLACAAAVATDAALAWANQQPEPEELEVKLSWTVALDRAGRSAEASMAARAIRAATDDPDLAARAALIEVEQSRLAGRYVEADSTLAALAPIDPGLRLLVQARRARSLAIAGRTDDALAACHAVATSAAARPAVERIDLLTNVQGVYAMLGRLSDMRALGRRIDTDPARAPFATRTQLARRAVEAIESGELGEGRAWLDRLGSTRGTSLHAHGLLNRIRLRAATGELEGVTELLEELAQLCESSGDAENLGWSRIADAYCGISLAEVRQRPWPAELPSLRPALRAALDACVRIARRRAGLEVGAAESAPHDEIDVELFRLRDGAEAATLDARFDDAKRAVSSAIDLARRFGYRLHEADLLALACDLHAASSDGERAAHFGAELRKLAEQMGSPRFVAESELAQALASSSPEIDPALLERLIEPGSPSPVAARRARALLDREGPLDRFDSLVVNAWRARSGASGATAPSLEPRASDPGDRSGWSFDPGTSAVALPGGRSVDLGRHALLARILDVLRDHGEEGATKEALVESAWEVRSYHPLRDDKRLYVAIRRLRTMIEDDPDRPARLVTTPRGYGLRDCRSTSGKPR